ncbi:MAG: CotH kinase family protein [Prevotellaceae bacterium]|nr:CotH kinase family protein [Prevotellaceae bacterium]
MTKKSFLLFVFSVLCTLVATAQTTYTRKTNLPHIYIETFNGKSITSKTTYIYSTMYYVDENDVVTRYDSMQIRGRGNSTWGMSKKPYKIKFQQKEKFLGKGYANAKKWTLMANAGDKTLMRNAITSLMGDFLGLKNNPAHKFVDLTLNNTYLGNYQISDQVEVRSHRVDITEQDYPLTANSDITGGYLLEVDGFEDGNCFTTSTYRVPIRIHYPEDEEISSSQNNYIRQYMRNFESVLSGKDFADAEKGYRKWVDSVSLVNWFLATEISGNIDGYYSTYFYKEQQDSLLYWGPLWDYDIAYNNDYRITGTETKLMTNDGYGQTKEWINRMWQDPWFGALVNRRYKEVVEAGLEEYMYQQIDSIVDLIYESQVLNYNRWGINTRMYHEVVLYSSYDQYITYLKNYIKAHMAYLQTAFPNKKVVGPTLPFVPQNYYYRISNVSTSKVFDVEGGVAENGRSVYSWTSNASRTSQQWRIVPVDDYFMIINRYGDVALNDPTPGTSTATTNTGTQLNVATTNIEDDRQLWTLTPQGTGGRYNITNKYTQHTANLNGGSSADGTAILSYTTDNRNSTSTNRQWYIIAGEKIEGNDDDEDNEGDGDGEGDGGNDSDDEDDNNGDNGNDDGGDNGNDDEGGDNGNDDGNEDEPNDEEPDAIGTIEPTEYALGYNPQTKILHFGSETPELLTFTAKIYSASGSLVRTFVANESCSIADLPYGVYLIMWNVDGKTRSAKVLVQ